MCWRKGLFQSKRPWRLRTLPSDSAILEGPKSARTIDLHIWCDSYGRTECWDVLVFYTNLGAEIERSPTCCRSRRFSTEFLLWISTETKNFVLFSPLDLVRDAKHRGHYWLRKFRVEQSEHQKWLRPWSWQISRKTDGTSATEQKSHSSLISPPRHATKRPWASPSRKWRGKTPISGLAKRCQSGEKFIMDITRSKAYQKNTHLRTQGPKTHDYHRLPRGETWIKKISVIRGPAVQAAEHDVQVNKPTESSQKVIGVTVPASKSKSLNHCAMGIKAPRPKSKTRLIATKVSPQIQWHQISPLRKVGRTNAPFTNKFIFQFGVNPVRLSWVRTGKVPEIPVLPTAGSAP